MSGKHNPNTSILINAGLVLLVVMSGAPALGQDSSSTVTESPTDRTVMVIMAPIGPVFAEVNISVDGRAYRQWVTGFLSKRVDLDSDGQLTLDELRNIPERLLQQTPARNARRALRQSTNNKNAKSVSTEKFNGWFASQLSRSFNLIAGAVQASEAVRLASHIDANGDGRVSREEVANGTYAMRFRDLDNDQSFTASELMPYRDPRNQQAAIVPDVANLPFVQLGDADSIERTAKQLVARYGQDGSVPLNLLRLQKGAIRVADASAGSVVTSDELLAFLQNPACHVTINVGLAEAANRSKLEITIGESAASFCSVEQTRTGRAKLTIDEMPIDIRSRGGSRGSRNIMTRMIMQRVSAYDDDKNGYLTEEEFPGLQQQMSAIQVAGTFENVDLNSDGMVFRSEIGTYIERDAIATQSRIEVSVKQDGKTLFKLLDKNIDRRLTTRELKEGFDALLEYDQNKDEQVTESELGTAYALQIGLGQAESMRMSSRPNMMGMGNRTDAVLPGVGGLDGPEWFRRMDRNQDRDVSQREFLGPIRIFEELDTNNDGLLSADEAGELTAKSD